MEEKILRLLAYFKDRRLNIKHLSELAEQLGVPAQVVIDFARWKALREVAHLGNEIVGIFLQVGFIKLDLISDTLQPARAHHTTILSPQPDQPLLHLNHTSLQVYFQSRWKLMRLQLPSQPHSPVWA